MWWRRRRRWPPVVDAALVAYLHQLRRICLCACVSVRSDRPATVRSSGRYRTLAAQPPLPPSLPYPRRRDGVGEKMDTSAPTLIKPLWDCFFSPSSFCFLFFFPLSLYVPCRLSAVPYFQCEASAARVRPRACTYYIAHTSSIFSTRSSKRPQSRPWFAWVYHDGVIHVFWFRKFAGKSCTQK